MRDGDPGAFLCREAESVQIRHTDAYRDLAYDSSSSPWPKEAADEALSLAEAAVRRWNALPTGTEEAQKHQAQSRAREREYWTGKCWSS